MASDAWAQRYRKMASDFQWPRAQMMVSSTPEMRRDVAPPDHRL
jgi:hypothetical protein